MNQIQVIDALAWASLLLAGLSTMYVAWDQFAHNPEAPVMKWLMGTGHPLYGTGRTRPLRDERQGARARRPRGVRQTALEERGGRSTVHCVAGDATSIIVAAAVTATLGETSNGRSSCSSSAISSFFAIDSSIGSSTSDSIV